MRFRLPANSILSCKVDRDEIVNRETLQGRGGAVRAIVFACFTLFALVTASGFPKGYRQMEPVVLVMISPPDGSLTIATGASTFSRMNARATGRSLILCAVVAAGLAFGVGCDSDRPSSATTGQANLFAASAMDVQPIFTQIAFWTHSPKADGIEAQLEFTDQFGDPTKASGKVLFELFGYRKDSPDPRGKRLGRWVGSLVTPDEQRERWNTTLRTYRFQLDYPGISTELSYVLTAIFEPTTGGRFFSRIVLPGQVPEKPAHKSSSPLGGP